MSMETLLDPGWRLVQKGLLGVVVFVGGDSSEGQNVMDFPVLHSTDHADCIPETPKIIETVRFSSMDTHEASR